MTEQGHTQMVSIKEAAEKLGYHPQTIRRWIKANEIPYKKIAGKYGEEYLVEVDLDQAAPDLAVKDLVNRLEALNQEVGYWRGRAEAAESQVKLLQAPRPAPAVKRPWYKRLFS